MADKLPQAGDVLTIIHPFCRIMFGAEIGEENKLCWRPGIEMVECGPYDHEAMAHGLGFQRLTVHGVFKPGRFPTRVFYTREFIDPDGKVFGNGKCRITSLGPFRVKARGYRNAFRIADYV